MTYESEQERVRTLARDFVDAKTVDQLRFLQGRMTVVLEFLDKTPDPKCPCACCKDGVNRLTHDRDPIGCWCGTYPPDQQCDCAYCAFEHKDA